MNPLKPLRWSLHAVENAAVRNLPPETVELTIREPEQIRQGRFGRTVYLRRYHDMEFEQTMLMRAIVEETSTEIVIVTVHSTSKITKYLRSTNDESHV